MKAVFSLTLTLSRWARGQPLTAFLKLVELNAEAIFGFAMKSGRGLPQSKTLARWQRLVDIANRRGLMARTDVRGYRLLATSLSVQVDVLMKPCTFSLLARRGRAVRSRTGDPTTRGLREVLANTGRSNFYLPSFFVDHRNQAPARMNTKLQPAQNQMRKGAGR